jgi:hypothetical protein
MAKTQYIGNPAATWPCQRSVPVQVWVMVMATDEESLEAGLLALTHRGPHMRELMITPSGQALIQTDGGKPVVTIPKDTES